MASTIVSRFIEELFPFWAYLRLKDRLIGELLGAFEADIAAPIRNATEMYRSLQIDVLDGLLAEEIKRGQALDEKTFKFGTSFATALTIGSASIAALSQTLPDDLWKFWITMFSIPAIVYSAFGGLFGLSAAATLPTFGIGAPSAVRKNNANKTQKPIIIAENLARQERANLVRSARNEASFMCIRNGVCFAIVALLVTMVGVALAPKKDIFPDSRVWHVKATTEAKFPVSA